MWMAKEKGRRGLMVSSSPYVSRFWFVLACGEVTNVFWRDRHGSCVAPSDA